jgi:hypothetical protein
MNRAVALGQLRRLHAAQGAFYAGEPADELRALLADLAGAAELIGVEITAFEAPEDERGRLAAAETAMRVLEPLLDALSRYPSK